MKMTEKLHGQCFWLLTVARGPFEDVGAVHVCDRSVKLVSFRFTAFFCKTVYSLSIFMCY